MSIQPLLNIVHRGSQAQESGAPLLLLLHGYGSNEEDLIGLAPQLDPRLVCISARAPYSLDVGGFAWFNIEWGPEGVRFDFNQALLSLEQLFSLLELLRQEHQPERVVVAGFSQGASMALATALRMPHAIAGVAALSGVCGPEILPADPESVRGLPVLMTHGRQDEVIPLAQAHTSRDLLQTLPVELQYCEYDMGHAINQACLEDLHVWLGERLSDM
jgi:phospholipase/carboxylesterase